MRDTHKPIIKTANEIKIMRENGVIIARILESITEYVKPGVNTLELSEIALDLCKKNNVEPSFMSVPGYNYPICTGKNDVAVHGIPHKEDVLENGDIISIDIGIKKNGYHSDHAVTLPVGEVDAAGMKLLETTKMALYAAVKQAKAGATTGDIGYVTQSIAQLAGFSPLYQMTGHGIGKELHEAPEVPCIGRPGTGVELKEGMIIAIEPMLNEFGAEIVIDKDGWTTRTKDGGRSAIFEHTVLVKKDGGEVLTKSKLF